MVLSAVGHGEVERRSWLWPLSTARLFVFERRPEPQRSFARVKNFANARSLNAQDRRHRKWLQGSVGACVSLSRRRRAAARVDLHLHRRQVRKLTCRPIPDCTGKEQRVLNRDGSLPRTSADDDRRERPTSRARDNARCRVKASRRPVGATETCCIASRIRRPTRRTRSRARRCPQVGTDQRARLQALAAIAQTADGRGRVLCLSERCQLLKSRSTPSTFHRLAALSGAKPAGLGRAHQRCPLRAFPPRRGVVLSSPGASGSGRARPQLPPSAKDNSQRAVILSAQFFFINSVNCAGFALPLEAFMLTDEGIEVFFLAARTPTDFGSRRSPRRRG